MPPKIQPAFDVESFLQSPGLTRSVAAYAAGAMIFTQGDPADTVLYIQSGRVKLSVVSESGKAAVVGTDGEVEHASALIHTLRFGNQLREEVAGVSFLPFRNKRAAPGCAIDVPMKHKSAEGTRSHFLTISFSIPDAPGPDEIVVALGIATSGRPHARIGDRYEDMKEMGVDQTGARTTVQA